MSTATRRVPQTKPDRIDPITTSVIQGALENIAVEMGYKLMRMSYSSIIRESEDFGAALVDAEGLPIALKLSEGQAHDAKSAQDMLEHLGAGQILLADRAYDSDAMRQSLAERGAWANVKPMPGRKNIPAFSAFLYKYRNRVERFFNKLKHFRAVATRYDKNPDNYLAGVKLASARIWMRFNESVT